MWHGLSQPCLLQTGPSHCQPDMPDMLWNFASLHGLACFSGLQFDQIRSSHQVYEHEYNVVLACDLQCMTCKATKQLHKTTKSGGDITRCLEILASVPNQPNQNYAHPESPWGGRNQGISRRWRLAADTGKVPKRTDWQREGLEMLNSHLPGAPQGGVSKASILFVCANHYLYALDTDAFGLSAPQAYPLQIYPLWID